VKLFEIVAIDHHMFKFFINYIYILWAIHYICFESYPFRKGHRNFQHTIMVGQIKFQH